MVHIFLKCYKLQTIRWTLTCLIYTHGIDADLAFLHFQSPAFIVICYTSHFYLLVFINLLLYLSFDNT